jgi:hypothetical protein
MIPSPTHSHFKKEGGALSDKEDKMVFSMTRKVIKPNEIKQAVKNATELK